MDSILVEKCKFLLTQLPNTKDMTVGPIHTEMSF